MSYKVVTDSCADLDTEIRKQYGIDYVKMSITVQDKVLPASLDWEEYSAKQLYDYIRQGIRVYTAQVSRQEFETMFENELKAGNDVIYIGCSSALSASVKLGKLIAEELNAKYKNKVYVIDSLNSSLGLGSMTIKCAELLKEGKTVEEAVEYIESNKLRFNQYTTVDSLKYLKRAGRVKAASAFFGDVMGVKPIIVSDAKGNNNALKKVRGRKNSLKELVEAVKTNAVDLENQTLYVCHADDIDTANELVSLIKKEVVCKNVYINYIGPIVGASVGPGAVAVQFFGNEVTIS